MHFDPCAILVFHAILVPTTQHHCHHCAEDLMVDFMIANAVINPAVTNS